MQQKTEYPTLLAPTGSKHIPLREESYLSRSQLLEHLWRGGEWAYLWSGKHRQSRWFRVADTQAILHELAADVENVYFGVHPCWAIPPHSITKRNDGTYNTDSCYIKGQKQYIGAVNCYFADWDDTSIEVLQHSLTEKGLPLPSVLVNSGGGLHGYWLFDRPILLHTEQERRNFATAQRLWVEKVGADSGAKDLARVLRLPGTLNTKYEPPRKVELV